MSPRLCGYCEQPLPRDADVRRRYCNGTCKANRCTAAARVDGRFDQWYQTSLERKRQAHTTSQCVVCSTPFSHVSRVRKYCSNRCAAKASYDARKHTIEWKIAHRDDVKRRRARKRNARVEKFTSVEIYERDGYRCHICRRKCPRHAVVPDPRAPTIDHLVPLAKGGDHTRVNVATACFHCNSVKGDRTATGDQLALVG